MHEGGIENQEDGKEKEREKAENENSEQHRSARRSSAFGRFCPSPYKPFNPLDTEEDMPLDLEA